MASRDLAAEAKVEMATAVATMIAEDIKTTTPKANEAERARESGAKCEDVHHHHEPHVVTNALLANAQWTANTMTHPLGRAECATAARTMTALAMSHTSVHVKTGAHDNAWVMGIGT